jgi:hypothetical protein
LIIPWTPHKCITYWDELFAYWDPSLSPFPLTLIASGKGNPFLMDWLIPRMSLSPSTNIPSPTQYQKDFAAWDLYQVLEGKLDFQWILYALSAELL